MLLLNLREGLGILLHDQRVNWKWLFYSFPVMVLICGLFEQSVVHSVKLCETLAMELGLGSCEKTVGQEVC